MVHIGCGADVIRQRRRAEQKRKEDEANGIFTVHPDWKPAKNKKYPHYTPLRNANVFNERQQLSWMRRKAAVLERQNSTASMTSAEALRRRFAQQHQRQSRSSSSTTTTTSSSRNYSTSSENSGLVVGKKSVTAPSRLASVTSGLANSSSPTASERSSPSSLSSCNSSLRGAASVRHPGSSSLYYIGRQEAIEEAEIVSSIIHEIEEDESKSKVSKNNNGCNDLTTASRVKTKRLAFRKTRAKTFAVIQVHDHDAADDDELPYIDHCDTILAHDEVLVEAAEDPCLILEADIVSYDELWPLSKADAAFAIMEDLTNELKTSLTLC